MALMDTVRQLMKGRSEAVERGVDAAVDRLGRYGETLKRQAEALKQQARTLDADRGGAGGATASGAEGEPPPVAPPPVAPPPVAPPAAAPPAAAPPAPPAAGGSSLKGDLADDDPAGGPTRG